MWFCKMITFQCLPDTEAAVKKKLTAILCDCGATGIQFNPMRPYWKIEGSGEIYCEFEMNDACKNDLFSLLSDKWRDEVSDAGWASLFCREVSFIWICH